jgi:hypothetical protein
MLIQSVTDFHPFHAFLQEELDSLPLVQFHENWHFWNGPGNFNRAWRAMALMAQSNSVTVLFSSIYTTRRAGSP